MFFIVFKSSQERKFFNISQKRTKYIKVSKNVNVKKINEKSLKELENYFILMEMYILAYDLFRNRR